MARASEYNAFAYISAAACNAVRFFHKEDLISPISVLYWKQIFFFQEEIVMFSWGIIFLVIAISAAALGFGALSGTAAWAAKVVFVVGIVLFLVNVILGRRAGP